MRFTMVYAASLAAVLVVGASAQDEPPPLHTEQGLKCKLVVEESETRQYLVDRKADKALTQFLLGRYEYRRFVMDGTLHGTQAVKHDRHVLDDFQLLTAMNPWDNLANLGAIQNFDMRQEPLTYHHRSGPVGAIYSELRTRKNGADAKAPVAVFGLTSGTQASYALKGQKMTFYETDPTVSRLVAEPGGYFSYVADARTRGADVEVLIGDKRARLKADKDRKYALIVVDIAESFPFCTDLFTTEAVQECFDRLTADGIVALHISNKYLRFEPMFAAMADEMKLTARVWNDDNNGRHGKTAASWVVLVRDKKTLGALDTPPEAKQFRPLVPVKGVPVWTDAKPDVWILWANPELQALRRLMGLPTPLERW